LHPESPESYRAKRLAELAAMKADTEEEIGRLEDDLKKTRRTLEAIEAEEDELGAEIEQ
jgi:uncharacterized protein YicC (UPF0701 family)